MLLPNLPPALTRALPYTAMLVLYPSLLPPPSSKNRNNSSVTASAKGGSPATELVASLRTSTSLLTYAAILAVDFRTFPRSFCKAEYAGYGLMDLGSGSYVFCAGVCSRWARGVGLECDGVGRRVAKSVPLLVLGLVRLLTVKGVDYQEVRPRQDAVGEKIDEEDTVII